MFERVIMERLDRIEEAVSTIRRENWLNIRGASDYTSLSIVKLRRAVASGELKASKKAGRLLFKIRWIDKWLNG